MVHSASLVHDDVIDQSDFRRGKPSVNALWNHKKVGYQINKYIFIGQMPASQPVSQPAEHELLGKLISRLCNSVNI